jgi:hypothetical protein
MLTKQNKGEDGNGEQNKGLAHQQDAEKWRINGGGAENRCWVTWLGSRHSEVSA